MRTTSEPEWDRRGEVAGLPVFWREVAGSGPPVLYVHGSPTSSDIFLPFLELTGGVAPDLPGFGRSGKPADFAYSIPGYGRFLHAFLDELGLERFSLVVHDWGGVGLPVATELSTRLERLVVIDAVPLLPGYRWHRIARLWRTPVVGELAMGFTTRWGMKQTLRESVADEAARGVLTDLIWPQFDHGTQRAILKLYRSAPPEELQRAGAPLGEIRCPALVVWGERDPYVPARFATAYAEALGGPVELELLSGAGHWPWLDRPDAVELVTGFLAGA